MLLLPFLCFLVFNVKYATSFGICKEYKQGESNDFDFGATDDGVCFFDEASGTVINLLLTQVVERPLQTRVRYRAYDLFGGRLSEIHRHSICLPLTPGCGIPTCNDCSKYTNGLCGYDDELNDFVSSSTYYPVFTKCTPVLTSPDCFCGRLDLSIHHNENLIDTSKSYRIVHQPTSERTFKGVYHISNLNEGFHVRNAFTTSIRPESGNFVGVTIDRPEKNTTISFKLVFKEQDIVDTQASFRYMLSRGDDGWIGFKEIYDQYGNFIFPVIERRSTTLEYSASPVCDVATGDCISLSISSFNNTKRIDSTHYHKYYPIGGGYVFGGYNFNKYFHERPDSTKADLSVFEITSSGEKAATNLTNCRVVEEITKNTVKKMIVQIESSETTVIRANVPHPLQLFVPLYRVEKGVNRLDVKVKFYDIVDTIGKQIVFGKPNCKIEIN